MRCPSTNMPRAFLDCSVTRDLLAKQELRLDGAKERCTTFHNMGFADSRKSWWVNMEAKAYIFLQSIR